MNRSSSSFSSDDPDEKAASTAHPAPDESIEALARRVLFAESLDEKLRPGAQDPRADPLAAPPSNSLAGVRPGRPEDLRFSSASAPRPRLPATPALVDEGKRGVLLHFFANHELLAAELMALAVLKFPDAPPAFRRGLAGTLREEQRHARWYIERMDRCGVAFGEYPVSRFFWDAVSDMETPLDYVSRLSLTFEQANLDYSRHYAGVLREAGDPRSAAILDRIHRDEIAHVGYGLRWFREWKRPGTDDWEELEGRLVFPLSPSRAKGNRTEFDAEGRREAGFGEDYIRRLSFFERSKGRTPDLHYFNPDAENRIAALPRSHRPGERVRSLVEDLEILAVVLARRDDVVLMRRPPGEAHRARLKQAGLLRAEIEALDSSGEIPADSLLHRRKIGGFRPWSRSPELPALFDGLQAGVPGAGRATEWYPGDRQIFSKLEQARALGRWFGEALPVRSPEEATAAAASLAEAGHREGMLKRSISTAGGGNRRVDLAALAEDPERILSRRTRAAMRAGDECLLEPRHERAFDFSVQYQAEGERLRLLDPVEQIVTEAGGYRGSLSPAKFCQDLDPALARRFMDEVLPVYQEGSAFARDLHRWAMENDYEGPLGVDAYLHRDAAGGLRHRVACEINARFTMGRVALELRRRVSPGFAVRFEIVEADRARSETPSPHIEGGRLVGGGLVLSELHAGSRYAARFAVAKRRSHF